MRREPPAWLAKARSGWSNTGSQRPPFAETPKPGQESVWDYPRPPVVVADGREVVVGDPSDPLARTTGAVRVLETASPPTVYLPPADVAWAALVEVEGSSFCEWKGPAQYWAFGAQPAAPIGWTYPRPFAEFASIAGWISFYPGRVACSLGGELVRPQAGGFYGGWITDEVIGPYKGEPGTGGW